MMELRFTDRWDYHHFEAIPSFGGAENPALTSALRRLGAVEMLSGEGRPGGPIPLDTDHMNAWWTMAHNFEPLASLTITAIDALVPWSGWVREAHFEYDRSIRDRQLSFHIQAFVVSSRQIVENLSPAHVRMHFVSNRAGSRPPPLAKAAPAVKAPAPDTTTDLPVRRLTFRQR